MLPEKDHCGSLPALSRRLPDSRVPGRLSARCAALHLVSDDRAQGPDPARVAPADRQPHLSAATIASRSARGTNSPRPAHEPAFLPRAELTAPRLAELARLDDAGFRELFAGSPVKRTGRDRFLRNVLIAIGNAPEPTPDLVAAARHCLDDASPLVRAAPRYGRSAGSPRRVSSQPKLEPRLADEPDPDASGPSGSV